MEPHIRQPRDKIVGFPPPPGVTPNFVDPPSSAPIVVITDIVFVAISTAFVAVRVFTTRFITHKIGVEDCLVAVSWLLAVAFSVTTGILTQYGLGRHIWDIRFSTFNNNFYKVVAISGMFYGISIMSTKLSVLVFYLRFSLQKNLRKVIYATMTVVIIYSLVASFQWAYTCQPLEKYWDFTITYGRCIDWTKIALFSGIMNTLTDAIILLLPVWMLWYIRLPKRQKIGVILVMMTGGFVLAISIVRSKITDDVIHSVDTTRALAYLTVWTTLEAHMAIVCACLPQWKPFLRRYFPRVIESSLHSSYNGRKLTIHSGHVGRHPPEHIDEMPLSQSLRPGLDGESPANMSTHTVEEAGIRNFETI